MPEVSFDNLLSVLIFPAIALSVLRSATATRESVEQVVRGFRRDGLADMVGSGLEPPLPGAARRESTCRGLIVNVSPPDSREVRK